MVKIRNNELMQGFEDMKTLLQYLYMNDENYVEVKNTLEVPLRIYVNEDGIFKVQNMNFPDTPPFLWEDRTDVRTCMDIVALLKNQSGVSTNKWEEIRVEVSISNTLTKTMKKERK